MHRIGVVGVSYRHTTVDQVARFAIPKADIPAHLSRLREALACDELVYLSTCNRVEVVFAVREGAAGDKRREVFEALVGRPPRESEAVAGMRTWTGEAAVEHLFLVACGLDSAQAGEQEISVQLRAAWQMAQAAQVTGPILDRILSESLGMARNARRIGRYDAPSIADVAVEQVRPSGTGAEVGLVGVSPMTRRCAIRLRDQGVSLVVINRSLDAAEELAREIGGRAVSLDAFRENPGATGKGFSALMCAIGSAEPVLDTAVLQKLALLRPSPLIVDFGLPPNVDADSATSVGLKRIGMSELVCLSQDTRVAHLMRLAPVRSAIDDRLTRLRTELAARAIGPQLAQMRDTFEQIATEEMNRLLNESLPDLDGPRREQLQVWAATLAHRLAHLPLSGMRAAAEHASTEAMDAFFREARLKRASHE